MAQTPSTMLPLGTVAPHFSLPNVVTGVPFSPRDAQGKPLLVVFMCNHCPFVVHVRPQLIAIGREYQPKGLAMVGISSNDVAGYPTDGPERMREEAIAFEYPFQYLFDETQEVAKAYHAACTPDFYLFDAHHRLAYRGQLDGSRPSNQVPLTGADMRAALDAVLAGQMPKAEQIPSVGCNIKWKPGNEPDYYRS